MERRFTIITLSESRKEIVNLQKVWYTIATEHSDALDGNVFFYVFHYKDDNTEDEIFGGTYSESEAKRILEKIRKAYDGGIKEISMLEIIKGR